MPSSLTNGYPVRLAILLPPTCVGLRYGHLNIYLSSFSRQREFIGFVTSFHSSSSPSLSTCVLHYKPASRFDHGFSIPVVRLSFCVPASNYCGGTGISTCCPSCTPFGLHLGPDLPWVDEPSPGNLRLSTGRFLASLSLLMPAFSLVYCPRPLPLTLLPVYIAPLPIRLLVSPRFGVRF